MNGTITVRQTRRSAGSLAVRLFTGTLAVQAMAPRARAGAAPSSAPAVPAGPALVGRVVAANIPGASAVCQVGSFHPGGPMRDKPEFAAVTRPGELLDPRRLLVAGATNFGAPLVPEIGSGGTILSIDPHDDVALSLPADFASAGGQAAAFDGRVRIYTASSAAFTNALNNAEAATAPYPAASNPLAISINNAFGRPWIANAPYGFAGEGTETVVDPDGRPLAGAPSRTAGGVFAGTMTNRQPDQLLPGNLSSGAIGTALLGKSPDGSGRAVFAVVNADGSIVQVHVEHGVDGLSPAATIQPLTSLSATSGSAESPAATRAGMIFNWVPDSIVYVADPLGNAVVALTLVDDGHIFHVERQMRITLPEFDVPVDLAPAVPEVVNPAFASNTTLAGRSDLYVLNRGNGTIIRLTQDGSVVGVRQVHLPGTGEIGGGRLNGIAVSADAQKLWVTLTGTSPAFAGDGAVLELPAFGATP